LASSIFTISCGQASLSHSHLESAAAAVALLAPVDALMQRHLLRGRLMLGLLLVFQEDAMIVLRAIALFILLFLLGLPLPGAQAGLFPLQPAEATAALAVRHPFYRGQCPRLCTEWFDGCNNCTCNRSGRFDVCTLHFCLWRGRPRCLRWGF
jgi:hypothetical protein